MSDEEKEAIETLKSLKDIKWYEHAFDNGTEVLEEEKQDIDIVLNLIEKQSKEIEELKEDNKHQWEERCKLTFELKNSTSNDKIKAKIEELENYYRELYKQDNSPNEFLIGQDCLSKLSILQEVLQSLLEKE